MSPKKCTPFKKMLFAIILIVLVEQGFSLKCYVCKSNKDGECGKDLKDELKQKCEESEPSTTTPEPSSTTSTTAEPSSTTSSTDEPSSTTSSTAEPSSTTSSTAEPSSTTSSTAETSPTTLSTTTTTTTTTTPKPTTPTTTVAPQSQVPEESKKPETVNRVRRQSELKTRADNEYVCYKYEHLENSETQISRGCAKKADFTCEAKSECKTCSEDGCNSASLANLGILSIIVPIIFTVSTFLNR